MNSLQKDNIIQIKRTVYSEEELKEIEKIATRGGAKIIGIKPVYRNIFSVKLEIDFSKRQF